MKDGAKPKKPVRKGLGAIASSETSVRHTLDNMMEGCMIIGFDWTYLYVNETAARHGQTKRENILGKTMLEMYPGVEKTAVFARYQDCMEKRTPQHFEESYTFADGKTLWYNFSVEPMPEGIFVLSIDITERKQMEAARIESEEKFRSLFTNSYDAILLTEPSGGIMAANPAACRMFGRTEQEIRQGGRNGLLDVTDPRLKIALKQRKKTGEVEGELTFVRSDGTKFPGEISSKVFFDRDNQARTSMIIRDITERKKSEQAMKDNEEKFRLAFMTGTDASYLATLEEGLILEVNDNFEGVFGYSREEAIGKTSLELGLYYNPPDRARIVAELKATGSVRDIEVQVKKKTGEIITISLSIGVLILNNTRHILGAVRDITKRKQMELDLENTNRVLNVICQCNQVLVRSTDENQLLNEVCRIIVAGGGYRFAWVGYAEQDKAKTVRPAAQYGFEEGYLRTANISWGDTESGRGPTGTAIRNGETSICKDILTDPGYVPWRQKAIEQGYASSIAIPLGDSRPAFGALNIYAIKTDAFNAPEIKLLTELANDLTYGILALRAKVEHEKIAFHLLESEERSKAIVENAPFGIATSGVDRRFLTANTNFCRMFGYTESELRDMTFKDITHPEDISTSITRMTDLDAGRISSFIQEKRYLRKDGKGITGRVSVSLVRDQSGNPQMYIAELEDITERKKIEEALQAKTKELDEYFTQALDLLCIADTDGYFKRLNKAWGSTLGYDLSDLEGHRFLDFVHPDDLQATLEAMSQLNNQKPVRSFINRYRCKDGSYRWIEWGSRSIGKNVYAVARDITERKLLENRLHDSEEKFRSLAEQSPNMIFINQAGRIVFVNHKCEEVMGYEKQEFYAPGFDFMKLIAPEHRELVRASFRAHMESREVPPYDYSLTTKDGRRIEAILSTKLIDYEGGKAIVGILTDITERKKLQEQLITQDRLASIGQLVSGVAHELNNPLTSVIGFSELLLQRELPDDIKSDLKIVNDEAKRTSLIVKNLLTFARQQTEGKTENQINDQIERVLALRNHEQSTNNIKVDTHFAPDLPRIMGNASQLQQVLFNIIINAEQAMLEAHNKGTLTITTERAGDMVRVSIADDGPGISPENMKKLFTPFFTTKGVGKGTGLGLSICQGIITEHSGKIYAESEPGKGATFIVELPLSKPA